MMNDKLIWKPKAVYTFFSSPLPSFSYISSVGCLNELSATLNVCLLSIIFCYFLLHVAGSNNIAWVLCFLFTIYRYLIIPLLLWFRYLLWIEILNCPTIRFPPQFNSVCHNAKGGDEEEEPSVTAVCIPVNVFRHKWSISRFFHLSNVTCILSTVTLLQPEELFFLL